MKLFPFPCSSVYYYSPAIIFIAPNEGEHGTSGNHPRTPAGLSLDLITSTITGKPSRPSGTDLDAAVPKFESIPRVTCHHSSRRLEEALDRSARENLILGISLTILIEEYEDSIIMRRRPVEGGEIYIWFLGFLIIPSRA
jgi:hypothetical protein